MAVTHKGIQLLFRNFGKTFPYVGFHVRIDCNSARKEHRQSSISTHSILPRWGGFEKETYRFSVALKMLLDIIYIIGHYNDKEESPLKQCSSWGAFCNLENNFQSIIQRLLRNV